MTILGKADHRHTWVCSSETFWSESGGDFRLVWCEICDLKPGSGKIPMDILVGESGPENIDDFPVGAVLASALMAANYPGDSGEDVDRLIHELYERGYSLQPDRGDHPAHDYRNDDGPDPRRAAVMDVLAHRASPPEYPGLVLVPVEAIEKLARVEALGGYEFAAPDPAPPWMDLLQSAYSMALIQIEADGRTIERLKRALTVAHHRPHDNLGPADPDSGFPTCSGCEAILTEPDAALASEDRP